MARLLVYAHLFGSMEEDEMILVHKVVIRKVEVLKKMTQTCARMLS